MVEKIVKMFRRKIQRIDLLHIFAALTEQKTKKDGNSNLQDRDDSNQGAL